MKSSTLNELKSELQNHPPKELVDLCIRLAKYKKENKELLTYLLFDSENESSYIMNIKKEMDDQFSEMNISHVYLAKKTIRKVLRTATRYSRYSDAKTTEVELLIYFCEKLKFSGIEISRYPILQNLYNRQIIKIRKLISGLHEDLQYDFGEKLRELE